MPKRDIEVKCRQRCSRRVVALPATGLRVCCRRRATFALRFRLLSVGANDVARSRFRFRTRSAARCASLLFPREEVRGEERGEKKWWWAPARPLETIDENDLHRSIGGRPGRCAGCRWCGRYPGGRTSGREGRRDRGRMVLQPAEARQKEQEELPEAAGEERLGPQRLVHG